MGRTLIRPITGIKTIDTFNDAVAAGAGLENAAWTLEEFLQGVISQLNRAQTATGGNWHDALTVPSTLETGVARGVNDLNDGLHAVEKKRTLREEVNITPITVGAGNNFVILGAGELPANTTAAVGAVTTLGTVVAAHGGTFGTHSLTEVAGSSAVSPKNLVAIVDDVTHDPILSGGNKIYGLLQSENASDGHTITDTTPNRIQISFVRINGAGNDLEAVPFSDIENEVIHYFPVERARLEDLNEQDFLTGRLVDVPTGATVTRQAGYNNQGTTPVDLTTNATLDLEAAGITWAIRDDLEANLFSIVEGSAGGTSQVNVHADVDELDIDAVVVDVANGATINSGGTRPIEIGVSDGILRSTAGDLEVRGTAELILNDGNLIAEGTWAGPGVKLSDTTAEVTAYEAEFGGEVSLFNAIVQAAQNDNRQRASANVTSNISANTLIEGPGGPGTANISADLLDYSNVGSFVSDVEVFINGRLQLNGADASANNDVYPSAILAEQQVGAFYAEFNLFSAPGNQDVIQMFITGS